MIETGFFPKNIYFRIFYN